MSPLTEFGRELSKQMWSLYEHALLLEVDELALLLEGVGIGDLLLPACFSDTLHKEVDAVHALVALSRDGLLPEGQDGTLGVDERVRAMLKVLHACTDTVVLQVPVADASPSEHPAFLYLSSHDNTAVLVREDDLRDRWVYVWVADAHLLLGAAYPTDVRNRTLRLICHEEDPSKWPWDGPYDDGVVRVARYYARGCRDAYAQELVVRSAADLLCAYRTADGITVPLGPDGPMSLFEPLNVRRSR